jgi:uncharacterized protein (UPF0248 family)
MSEKNEQVRVYATLRVSYKNSDDVRFSSNVDFTREVDIASLSKKENLEDAIFEIADGHGVWINNTLFIPFHRILAIEACDSVKKPNQPKPENQPNQPKQEKVSVPNTKKRTRVRKGNNSKQDHKTTI